jgi:thioredoxin-related protein
MKYLLLSICTVLSIGLVSGQIDFEHEEWKRVKAQAKKENKIVFVDAYTTWCGPCKWMAKNVFTDEAVGDFYNKNFINLKLDMEKGEGLAFAQEYQVNAYPTLLFVDGEGSLVHKHLGAVPAEQFLTVGQDAVSPERRIGSYIDKYPAMKHDKAFLQEYVVKMMSAGMQVGEAANSYFDLLGDSEVVSEKNLLIMQMMQPSLDSKAFELLLSNRSGFNDLAGAEVVDGLVERVLTSQIYKTVMTKDPAEYQFLRAQIASLDLPEKERVLTIGDMEYSDAQGDMASYLKHAAAYSKTYHWNDWNELNNLAWDMYLNTALTSKSQLKLAKKMAKRAVALEPNYYTTDTYASVLYKIGKYDAALEWANTAIQAAKAAGEDYSGTSLLVDKIKAAQ